MAWSLTSLTIAAEVSTKKTTLFTFAFPFSTVRIYASEHVFIDEVRILSN